MRGYCFEAGGLRRTLHAGFQSLQTLVCVVSGLGFPSMLSTLP